MDEAEAVVRVTLYAMEDPQFRGEWDRGVRDAADAVCAQVAGQRMAGAAEGRVEHAFRLPVPPGMDAEDAALAFNRAVTSVVTERMNAMGSPGGPG